MKLPIDDWVQGIPRSQLQQTDVDILKIDQSFVSLMDQDASSAAIVSAIITLGHAMGLTLVAEGVERPTQAALLRQQVRHGSGVALWPAPDGRGHRRGRSVSLFRWCPPTWPTNVGGRRWPRKPPIGGPKDPLCRRSDLMVGVSARFEELDWRPTPLGAISLRRRRDPQSGDDVYEVKLDDDFLMSSLFTVAEIEVARLALAELAGPGLDVAVGGLGLGYTAQTVLEHPNVRSLVVVEALGEVIEWHERGLIPVGAALTSDSRCRFVHGDFFAMVAASGLDPDGSGPTLSRHRRRHRSFAASSAASEPRRVLRARGDASSCRSASPGRCLCPVVERPAGPGLPGGARGCLRSGGGRDRQLPQPTAGARGDQYGLHRQHRDRGELP